MQAHSRRWIYAAIVYLCLGITLGVFMGASRDHTLFPVHAHINLLGWVSLALIGFIYHFFPVAGASRLASAQFWLHNAALWVMMVALSVHLYGNQDIEKVVGLGSVVMAASIFLFAGNVLLKRA